MARSRSSFDVDGAIATATSLTSGAEAKHRKKERAPAPMPGGAPLVRFASRPPPPPPPAPPEPEPESPLSITAFEEVPSSELPPSSTADMTGGRGLRSALPPSTDDVNSMRGVAIGLPSPASVASIAVRSAHVGGDGASRSPTHVGGDGASRSPTHVGGDGASRSPTHIDDVARELAGGRPLPRLPDLGALPGPVQRCEKMVEWIVEATGATDVFLADASGLPLAGAIRDTETRLAASGLIASAVGSLVAALPGAPSQRFELHVGDGPFFQLIGFQVSSAAYVVGLMRASPLTPHQAHAVRVACRHALGETLGGAR